MMRPVAPTGAPPRSLPRPPGPRGGGLPTVLRARRDPLGFMLGLKERFGDAAWFHRGPFDVYLFSHPDAVRQALVTQGRAFMKGQGLQEAKRILGEGLLTSEGEFHHRQRRLVQPIFHHQRIAGYGRVMVEDTSRLIGAWGYGRRVAIHAEMLRLTLGSVG